MKRFELLAGVHIQADHDWEPDPDSDVPLEKQKRPSKKFVKGDTVESRDDLVKNLGDQKFRFLGESVAKVRREPEVLRIGDGSEPNPESDESTIVETEPTVPNEELDSMTVVELHELAEAEEIDLGTAKTKPQLLKAIKTARASKE